MTLGNGDAAQCVAEPPAEAMIAAPKFLLGRPFRRSITGAPLGESLKIVTAAT
jgi:hypothetical protein